MFVRNRDTQITQEREKRGSERETCIEASIRLAVTPAKERKRERWKREREMKRER